MGDKKLTRMGRASQFAKYRRELLDGSEDVRLYIEEELSAAVHPNIWAECKPSSKEQQREQQLVSLGSTSAPC